MCKVNRNFFFFGVLGAKKLPTGFFSFFGVAPFPTHNRQGGGGPGGWAWGGSQFGVFRGGGLGNGV